MLTLLSTFDKLRLPWVAAVLSLIAYLYTSYGNNIVTTIALIVWAVHIFVAVLDWLTCAYKCSSECTHQELYQFTLRIANKHKQQVRNGIQFLFWMIFFAELITVSWMHWFIISAYMLCEAFRMSVLSNAALKVVRTWDTVDFDTQVTTINITKIQAQPT